MNSYNALLKVIKLVPDNIDDIITRSNTIETKISGLSNKVQDYETQANTFINGFFTDLSGKVNFDGVTTFLNNGSIYPKLKNQDLSGLLSGPQTTTGEEAGPQAIAAEKITWLNNFLKPLELPNNDQIVSLLQDILTEIFALPDALEKTEGLTAMYQQVKTDQLQDKIQELISLFLGTAIPANPPNNTTNSVTNTTASTSTTTTNTTSTTSTSPSAGIDALIPQIEQEFQQLEGQTLSADAVHAALSNLLPLLGQIGIPINTSSIEPVLTQIVTQIKTVDFAQPRPTVVNDVVKAIANLSNQYLATGEFSALNEIIQKIQLIVNFVVSNNLIVPIKFKWLSPTDTLPSTGIMPVRVRSQQANPAVATTPTNTTPNVQGQTNTNTADTNVTNTATSTNSTSTTASTTAGTTGSGSQQQPSQDAFSHLVEKLVMDGISQLPALDKQFGQSLWQGSAFFTIITTVESFQQSIEQSLMQAWENIVAPFQDNKPVTLDQLVQIILTQLTNAIKAVISVIQQLVTQFIQLLASCIQFLIKLVLAIKLPSELTSLAPSLSSLQNINLLCLLIALPWELVVKLHNADQSLIQGWM